MQKRFFYGAECTQPHSVPSGNRPGTNSKPGAKPRGGINSPAHKQYDSRERIRLDVIGVQKSRTEVLNELAGDQTLFYRFKSLSANLQEEFLEYCMGVRGLTVSYDAVFKHIFDPSLHRERLEDFLSECIGKKVRILKVLPNESMRTNDEDSLVIMDIVVQFTDSSVACVEIQRIGYKFPGARCACYSSDMVVRRYNQLKEDCRRDGITFNYTMLGKVYTIVLMKDSPHLFARYPDTYVHRASQRFDSGLELDLLQEYVLIPLDIFFENRHNKGKDNAPGRLDAWLYFIGSDDPEDILDVIQAWPDFKELYRDVFWFRDHRKELINVYSSVLSEYDRNTVYEMIDDIKAEAKANIEKKDLVIAEKDARIRELEAQLRSLGKMPD